MTKMKATEELTKALASEHPVKLTGSMVLYLLNTLREKSVGLGLANMLANKEGETEQMRANSIVGAWIMMKAEEIFGEEYIKEYMRDNVEMPDIDSYEAAARREHGKLN